MKLLFVTDLHGGNIVFRKSLRLFESLGADYLLVGGDIAGKYLVPIVDDNNIWRVREDGKNRVMYSDHEVRSYIDSVAEFGGYAVICSTEEATRLRLDDEYREEILRRERINRLRLWLGQVKERVASGAFLLNMGNDDPFYLDLEVEQETGVSILEDRYIDLADGLQIVSCGYTNETPWHCPRDCSEEELWLKLSDRFRRCADPHQVIANFHCPPILSRLDRAPLLDNNLHPIVGADGVEFTHVGSTAVRRALATFSPLVALHGHIHESYATERIGDTICANPGSSYHSGDLRAVLVHLNRGRVGGVQLIRER
jgi:Icc-related predicted phosphoesterase